MENIIKDEVTLSDSLRGVITIVDNNTGEIVLKHHNMIVSDGRRTILKAFASWINSKSNSQLQEPLTGDNRLRFFISLRAVVSQYATTRELNYTTLTGKQTSSSRDPEEVNNIEVSVNDDYPHITITHNVTMTDKSIANAFIKFNEINFLLSNNEEYTLFSRIALDDTFVLSNSSYSISYYIYF